MSTEMKILAGIQSDSPFVENGVFKGPLAQHNFPVNDGDTVKYTLSLFQTDKNHFEVSRFGRRVLHDPDVEISYVDKDLLQTWMLMRQAFTLLRMARTRRKDATCGSI